jgi:hypothetical protein
VRLERIVGSAPAQCAPPFAAREWKEICPGATERRFGGGAQLSSCAAPGARPDTLPQTAAMAARR